MLSQERVPLWLVKDRWKRDIILYEDTWYGQILTGHAEFHTHEAALAKVLEKPYCVTHGVLEENRECFYAQIRPTFPGVLVKVVVEFDSEHSGVVVSAFLTGSIRPDEMQRWP